MILLLYLNQFYKTEQGVGSSPNRNPYCIVRGRLCILLLCSHRTNRTCSRDEVYPIGKLKEGIPGEPCEDDPMLSKRVESISSIKFFHYLQLGDAVFCSQAHRGITRRNHHTDASAQKEIIYQQTEVFFMVVQDVDSVMTCGAALAQMPKGEKYFANTLPCNTGLSSQSPCSHFQTKRGHFFCIVCLRLIVMTETLPHAWDTRGGFLFAS